VRVHWRAIVDGATAVRLAVVPETFGNDGSE
jgi:hypothetical protein